MPSIRAASCTLKVPTALTRYTYSGGNFVGGGGEEACKTASAPSHAARQSERFSTLPMYVFTVGFFTRSNTVTSWSLNSSTSHLPKKPEPPVMTIFIKRWGPAPKRCRTPIYHVTQLSEESIRGKRCPCRDIAHKLCTYEQPHIFRGNASPRAKCDNHLLGQRFARLEIARRIERAAGVAVEDLVLLVPRAHDWLLDSGTRKSRFRIPDLFNHAPEFCRLERVRVIVAAAGARIGHMLLDDARAEGDGRNGRSVVGRRRVIRIPYREFDRRLERRNRPEIQVGEGLWRIDGYAVQNGDLHIAGLLYNMHRMRHFFKIRHPRREDDRLALLRDIAQKDIVGHLV